MEAQTRADDGMDLLRVETFQAPSAAGLPGEKELTEKIEKMAADLNALRKAPVAEPYDGPALLSDGRQRCSSMKCSGTGWKATGKRMRTRADVHEESWARGATEISECGG